MRALLVNLTGQGRRFDVVCVVDASGSDRTQRVCEELAASLGPGALEYVRCAPGLPAQRQVGIDVLRRHEVDYICFFDDDVLLDPAFVATIVAFMESDEGRPFGGVSGYDDATWGQPFNAVQRLFHGLGVFDGELRPGRWLYCGYFLELDHLDPPSDVFECDFLPGFQAVWRTEVFDHFSPPSGLKGYALGEDKHLSLRIGSRYRLAVHPAARTRHMRAEGGRPKRSARAIQRVRMDARLVRDCDPSPSALRYASFLGATLLNTIAMLFVRVLKGQFRDLGPAGASAVGWLSCIVAPPRRTRYALAPPSGHQRLGRSGDGAAPEETTTTRGRRG